LAFHTPDICSTDKDVQYKMAPKQRFDVDINRSVDPTKWIQNKMGEGAKTVVWPYDQGVQVREGWVYLEPSLTILGLPNEQIYY